MIICTMPQCQTTAGCICGLPFAPVGSSVMVRAFAPINENESKVLDALSAGEDSYSGHAYFSFAALMSKTRLDRKAVRMACRSLARKGLAEFGKGLWSDDGEPAGSGYAITKAGVSALTSAEGNEAKT